MDTIFNDDARAHIQFLIDSGQCKQAKKYKKSLKKKPRHFLQYINTDISVFNTLTLDNPSDKIFVGSEMAYVDNGVCEFKINVRTCIY